MTFRNHLARFLRAGNVIGLIRSKPALARFAVNHWITERVHVSTGFPDLRRHDDGGFEANHVVALAGHGVPPELLDIALEFGAQRAVIPKTVDAAVNFRGWIDEAAPLAQRHDFFHEDVFFRVSHRRLSVCDGHMAVNEILTGLTYPGGGRARGFHARCVKR